MQLLRQLIQNVKSEIAEVHAEINKPFYFCSFGLEDGYFYHTTYWKNLKGILRDGFLSGNPVYLKERGVRQFHPNMICFTTSKWRHLSNMPNSMFFGITHDCYLKIPREELIGKVKPVIYEVNIYEIESIIEAGQYHYLATLTHDLDKLRRELGISKEDLPNYLYKTWFFENEFRMKADRYFLPETTEVYVSSYYQRRIAQKLTHLPVYVDKEIMKLKRKLSFRPRIRRKIRRIVGDDLYRKIRYIEVYTRPEERPDGSKATIWVRLYDVRFLDAIPIVKRLKEAGLKVWIPHYAWKYRPYADLKADLKWT